MSDDSRDVIARRHENVVREHSRIISEREREMGKPMRDVNQLILHHSVTPHTMSDSRALQILSQTHTKNFKSQGQPPSDSGKKILDASWIEPIWDTYPNISYHIVIGQQGVYHTRMLDVVGWHAGNYPVNLSSDGICLLGDFETERPTAFQQEKLKDVIQLLFDLYGKRLPIKPHSEVRLMPTKCCGRNLKAFIPHLLDMV